MVKSSSLFPKKAGVYGYYGHVHSWVWMRMPYLFPMFVLKKYVVLSGCRLYVELDGKRSCGGGDVRLDYVAICHEIYVIYALVALHGKQISVQEA